MKKRFEQLKKELDIKTKLQRILSLAVAKNPATVLLIGIVLLNIALVLGAAAILVILFPDLAGGSFWKTAYNVFTMILDAGCISNIVDGKYGNNPVLSIICIVVIFIGTLIFTGAIIGYLSNMISNFIDDSNNGARRLVISDHIVIVNWNNRASEIINDLLYSDNDEKVVILVDERKEEIEREIKNRIADTIEREKSNLAKQANKLIEDGKLSKRDKHRYIKEHYNIRKPTVIVRQGETYSLKQLNDISVLTAKNIIILGKNHHKKNAFCAYDTEKVIEKAERGNIETVKALVQVAQIASSQESADDQKIVVEIEDDWTMDLVNKIIKHKAVAGKCKVIPIPVNRILGQILSQFSIMPELNSVYSELFSNKGATFYSKKFDDSNEISYFTDYFDSHKSAIPITTMDTSDGRELYYIANNSDDINIKCGSAPNMLPIKLNESFQFEKKHIVIIGHNSKSMDILEGFNAFISEWDHEHNLNLVDILIIDDKEHLEKVDYYKEFRGENGKYSFIKKVVAADVYDSHIILPKLNEYIDSHPEDTSVLILSNDYVPEEEYDSSALTYLVYIQDIVHDRIETQPGFDPASIDIIVELLNPKNYDVVRSYSVNNVIISNRYISRMIVQIGEKESIYEFYKDILTYDTEIKEDDYDSKELYIKDVKRFFDPSTQFPIVTTPRDLVPSIYNASPAKNKTIVLGIVKDNNNKVLFTDSVDTEISIGINDKLILFSPH